MTSENLTRYRKGWNLNLSLLGLEVVSDTGEVQENETLESLQDVTCSPAAGDTVLLSIRLTSGRVLEFPDFPAASSDDIRSRITELREIKQKIALFIPNLLKWLKSLTDLLKEEYRTSGYITDHYQNTVFAEIFKSGRPECGVADREETRDYFAEAVPENVRHAFDIWKDSPEHLAAEYNDSATAGILKKYAPFFQTIEKSPLTEEQARAVVNLNNRLLLVASAGSGKTSVMVAKAAYALLFGYFRPERIVLIAFNRKAVNELRERIRERFSAVGLPWENVRIETFHALSYKITRKLASPGILLASMLQDGRDGTQEFLNMLRDLMRRKEAFRIAALYFCSLSQSMNRNSKAGAVWRSAEEIVSGFLDWLTVSFEENEHPSSGSLAEYLVYRDRKGEALSFVLRIAEDDNPPEEPPVSRKRRKRKKQREVITFSEDSITSGNFIVPLVRFLHKKGFRFREVISDKFRDQEYSLRFENFYRTVRSFLTHAKNSLMSPEELWRRYCDSKAPEWHNIRTGLFLKIYSQAFRAWTRLLDGGIDFEDMLNLSVQALEKHPEFNPYDLIMVDEAQDISLSRARLLSLLTRKPQSRLFAVGDDWQSINRFSGAVIHVMSDFAGFFGKSDILKLETTFRCSQEICDVSSEFISKNKSQISKTVRGRFRTGSPSVVTVNADCEPEIPEVVEILLRKIIREAAGKPVSVMLLGRYNDDRKHIKKILYHPEYRHFVQFMTVHKSKGLEADYVIIIRATSGILGFPCSMEDDRILDLVMPENDSFRHSEERRLFYVGITRARIRSYIITLWDEESEFTEEINDDIKQSYLHFDIDPQKVGGKARCPRCRHGITFLKRSKFGLFYSCCRYPRCTYTEDYCEEDDEE